MKVIWTEPAAFDLDDLYDYIAKDSPLYAEQFIDRIIEAANALANSPRIGKIVPEEKLEHLRQRIVQSQRIIYEIDDRNLTIYIMALVHVRQDLATREDKPWK